VGFPDPKPPVGGFGILDDGLALDLLEVDAAI
jgi:hypothetical protein